MNTNASFHHSPPPPPPLLLEMRFGYTGRYTKTEKNGSIDFYTYIPVVRNADLRMRLFFFFILFRGICLHFIVAGFWFFHSVSILQHTKQLFVVDSWVWGSTCYGTNRMVILTTDNRVLTCYYLTCLLVEVYIQPYS